MNCGRHKMPIYAVLCLAIIGGLLLVNGTAWSASWLVNLGLKFGATAIDTTRITLVAAISSAVLIGALWLRPKWQEALSRVAMTTVAFIAAAELAALIAKPVVAGQVYPAIALIGSLAPLVMANHPWMRGTAAPTAASSNGRVITVASIALVVSIAITARVSLHDTIHAEDLSGQGFEPIELDTPSWIGRTLPATGIARHLPILTAKTLEGTSYIVFYNPHCSHCRELFETALANPNDARVIAVEVPPAQSQNIASGDDLGPIDCGTCDKLTLPMGPLWLVDMPTLVRVENGVVTCVATKEFERCVTQP